MSFFSTMLAAALGGWLAGMQTNVRIRGTQAQIEALTSALMASKRFQDELHRPGATVESVVQKLGVKQMSEREFERVFGVSWPLAFVLGTLHIVAHYTMFV
jgi:hypothetical protein